MKIKDENSLQEWLIGLALCILVPLFLYLGADLISPKVNYGSYYKAKHKFFKGYKDKESEKYKSRILEWEKTFEFTTLCSRNFRHLVIIGTASCALMYVASFFTMSIIAASLVISSLVSLLFYYDSYEVCTVFYDIHLFWLEFLFILINLVIVLVASYRLSKD